MCLNYERLQTHNHKVLPLVAIMGGDDRFGGWYSWLCIMYVVISKCVVVVMVAMVVLEPIVAE